MIEASSVTGSAKAVLEFGKEAVRAHSNVDLSAVTFNRHEDDNDLTRAVRGLGIPIHVVPERRRFDSRIASQLRALVAKERADVIWSNSVKSHFLVRWTGLKNSGTWVAFHHGYTSTDTKMLVYNQLDRWSLQAADRVLTSSRAFIGELQHRQVPAHRIHVQHMPLRAFEPVSDQRKAQLRRELRLNDQSRIILCVGRMSREKGHIHLLQAFAEMQQTAPDAQLQLVLVGAGPERPRLEALCRTMNLAERVTFAGQQSDVDPYYAIADVFVLPSLSEGSPNVLLEAIAAGVPVVASAVGGIPEIVHNEHDALLVNACDVPGLAAAILRLLNDGELRNRLVANSGKIVSRHSPEAYFQSLMSIFSQASAGRHASS